MNQLPTFSKAEFAALFGAESPTCPDCAVAVGEQHIVGCDVARCKGCGMQALGCVEHYALPQTRWTGQWPGVAEVLAGTADCLNDLAIRAARGEVVWDQAAERFNARSSVGTDGP